MESFTALMTLLFLIAAYFLPSIVAHMRGHRQTLAIFMLNLFIGWTFFGWVVAIVWASTNDRVKVIRK